MRQHFPQPSFSVRPVPLSRAASVVADAQAQHLLLGRLQQPAGQGRQRAVAGLELQVGEVGFVVALLLRGQAQVDGPLTEMNYGFASWDHKFMDTHLTLRREKGRLVVEHFGIFKDGSSRSNYVFRYEFKSR